MGKNEGVLQTAEQQYVFHYSYVLPGDFYRLVKTFKLLKETKNHVQIRHWYGKRWYPKNNCWRIEL